MLKLVSLNGNDQVAPLPVAGAILAKSSAADVWNAVVAHTDCGNVSESVDSVVLGFMAMTLNVVEFETTRVKSVSVADKPVTECRWVPANINNRRVGMRMWSTYQVSRENIRFTKLAKCLYAQKCLTMSTLY